MVDPKNICDDCLRTVGKNNLVTTFACARDDCCYKNICRDTCVFICSTCNRIIENNNGYKHNNKIYCNNCKTNETKKNLITWYGLSFEEYNKRYY